MPGKGKRFEKGHKSKGGRPPTSPEIKEFRSLTRKEVEEFVKDLWMMDEGYLDKKMKDPLTPVRDKLIIRVILRGIAKGDSSVMGFLTDFIFGERPKKLKVENDAPPAQVIVMLPPKNGSRK